MELQGKIALVTGAASAAGLGFATARLLARRGAAVWLTDIDAAGAEARAAELAAQGFAARGMGHDVTSASGWAEVLFAIARQDGRGPDILVNNAGIAVLRWTPDLEPDEWQRQIDVNLTSVYLGCRAVLPAMRAAGDGAIVNISSVAGLVGIPGASAYAASKGGVRLYTKSLAMECAREGIRVNSVHPGVIWTEMQQVAIRDNPDQYDAINASIPAGRMGEPDDIAQAVAFLASPAARYITGAELAVDGGLTAQ
ncbi:NAD(P)-dependent dehydrogenase, short-chain alcohol dehydrogenase family [Novosphingobium aromaticivorans]|uniref:SDR family NAD(P)-dependent oxidoreductase n=1 Tax=Novosphingobium aromaticivorans TaxID=48935 RepID=UPI000038A01E|nr:SDR family NAD(P)-dependent oxidoreductase [Novosphingobium aromaticivorans]SCY82207.1 NAD(P)-dependent dehydrogenase, short-chain alcohol dehydrogenase family [Novosphingobium aromaticivorans]